MAYTHLPIKELLYGGQPLLPVDTFPHFLSLFDVYSKYHGGYVEITVNRVQELCLLWLCPDNIYVARNSSVCSSLGP